MSLLGDIGVRRTLERHPRHGFTVCGEPPLRVHARRVRLAGWPGSGMLSRRWT
jgi:hypothetical protein